MNAQVAPAKIAEKGLQGGILLKLFAFSISLAVIPISSYFISDKYIWDGNSTFAALTAVFSANLVLAGYIAVSVREESKAIAAASMPADKPAAESKKDQ